LVGLGGGGGGVVAEGGGGDPQNGHGHTVDLDPGRVHHLDRPHAVDGADLLHELGGQRLRRHREVLPGPRLVERGDPDVAVEPLAAGDRRRGVRTGTGGGGGSRRVGGGG